MATTTKKHFSELWPRTTKRAKRDPATEQLRRDRITALIIIGVMALVFAVIAILSSIDGGATGTEVFDPWIMP